MQDASSTPLPKLAPREADSHKGDYGRVLVIGGSRGMAGAPALAGMAALRSGAGLVTVAVPRSIQATVASFEPSYMTVGLGGTADDYLVVESLPELTAIAQGKSAVALGPGLGADDSTVQLVCKLYQELSMPLIVDADGLNALAKHPECLQNPGGVRILTPHPGEFERLNGLPVERETDKRCQQAADFCGCDSSGKTLIVLKGHGTVVAEGERFIVNETGNPGMATGGTGDCLTGVITALVAQGLSPFDAARLGVHIHGLAGDLAANELGQTSMIASDLVRFLPKAFRQVG